MQLTEGEDVDPLRATGFERAQALASVCALTLFREHARVERASQEDHPREGFLAW